MDTIFSALSTGKYRTALITFKHGLGDSILFYTAVQKLRDMFPDIRIDYSTHRGQEEVFGKVDESADYDIRFDMDFPESAWDPQDETKLEKCCRLEVGIPSMEAEYTLPVTPKSPLVGMHYFSTCAPALIGMLNRESFARRIWTQVCDNGLIPLDTMMRGVDHNPANVVWHWETQNMTFANPTVPNLLGVLGSCCGFAGITSGNFHAAMSVLPPERILAIETAVPVRRLTRKPVFRIDANRPYDSMVVQEWLDEIRKYRES